MLCLLETSDRYSTIQRECFEGRKEPSLSHQTTTTRIASDEGVTASERASEQRKEGKNTGDHGQEEGGEETEQVKKRNKAAVRVPA
jgi:hypothetical protein